MHDLAYIYKMKVIYHDFNFVYICQVMHESKSLVWIYQKNINIYIYIYIVSHCIKLYYLSFKYLSSKKNLNYYQKFQINLTIILILFNNFTCYICKIYRRACTKCIKHRKTNMFLSCDLLIKVS